MRAHQSEDFWGIRLGSPLSPLLQGDGYFSVGDLIAKPESGFPDHLSEVAEGDCIDFLCGLFFIVLIDQVMYTHRRQDYAEFRSLTRYPKMDRTIGWSRHATMANPFEVFSEEVIESHRLNFNDIEVRFASWVDFMIDDLHAFFEDRSLGDTTWARVRTAMLFDPDCTNQSLGALLARGLRSDGGEIF